MAAQRENGIVKTAKNQLGAKTAVGECKKSQRRPMTFPALCLPLARSDARSAQW
jgi:hypothetical protein